MFRSFFLPPRQPGKLSRRHACALGVSGPLFISSSGAASEPDAEMLVQRSRQQAKLFNAGRMTEWFDVAKLASDFTLMQPFGGPVIHGFDGSPQHLAELAANFTNGDAEIELEQAIVSETLIALVYVERQDGEVRGLPKQDWSLRVTQVFRKRCAEWELVHRHADPLVRRIPLGVTAALAGGRALSESGGRS